MGLPQLPRWTGRFPLRLGSPVQLGQGRRRVHDDVQELLPIDESSPSKPWPQPRKPKILLNRKYAGRTISLITLAEAVILEIITVGKSIPSVYPDAYTMHH